MGRATRLWARAVEPTTLCPAQRHGGLRHAARRDVSLSIPCAHLLEVLSLNRDPRDRVDESHRRDIKSGGRRILHRACQPRRGSQGARIAHRRQSTRGCGASADKGSPQGGAACPRRHRRHSPQAAVVCQWTPPSGGLALSASCGGPSPAAPTCDDRSVERVLIECESDRLLREGAREEGHRGARRPARRKLNRDGARRFSDDVPAEHTRAGES